jgi:hypothetical protein
VAVFDYIAENTPLRRVITPAEFAATVLKLWDSWQVDVLNFEFGAFIYLHLL